VDLTKLAISRPHASGDIKRIEHRIVDVESFGSDVENLAGLLVKRVPATSVGTIPGGKPLA
jgi:hypothetical protein